MTQTVETITAEAQLEAIQWGDIAKVGGIDAWVKVELERRGLKDSTTDPSKLTDAEKKGWKARRDEERRVRKTLYRASWKAYQRAHLVHLGVGIFYHDTADIDRFDIADPTTRREENELPKLDTVHDLAKALNLTIPRLRWLAYHREVDSGTHYVRWLIPKRDGTWRLISAPKKELKQVQRWIAKNITEHLPVHGAAHGFLAGRSTKTNAIPHADARLVVKIDLKDFYPTVTFPRVKGIFRKAGYGEQVATVLALLVTEPPREPVETNGKIHWVATGPRSLPQGAPTSPSITNTLCRRLDARVLGLSQKTGLNYTRYADDLTFSGGRGNGALGKFLHRVRLILENEGFKVHPDKTRVMRSGGRQKVTGLVVNAAPGRPPARVPRKVVRELRAAVHNREHGKAGKDETLMQLKGLAAYVHMTDPQRGRAFIDRIEKLEAAKGDST